MGVLGGAGGGDTVRFSHLRYTAQCTVGKCLKVTGRSSSEEITGYKPPSQSSHFPRLLSCPENPGNTSICILLHQPFWGMVVGTFYCLAHCGASPDAPVTQRTAVVFGLLAPEFSVTVNITPSPTHPSPMLWRGCIINLQHPPSCLNLVLMLNPAHSVLELTTATWSCSHNGLFSKGNEAMSNTSLTK